MQQTLFPTASFKEHKKYIDGKMKTKDEIIEIAASEGRTKIFRVLSFGGGTQSAHLLEAHFRGEIPYDLIVFADTGAEPQFIHDQVVWWQARQKEVGNKTPFFITGHKSMEGGLEEMLMRYIFTSYQRFQMPLYFNWLDEETGEIKPAGMMKRQCTVEFKIVPVQQMAQRFIKHQYGLREKQRVPRDVAIIMDIGFSADEINRVGGYISYQSKYIYLAYPLIEMELTTDASIQFLKDNNFPSKRSRCYFCPFNCDGEKGAAIGMAWEEIIKDEPLSFLKAAFFDEHLRRVQRTGRKRMLAIPYFHNSRLPLKEVYADAHKTLLAIYANELDEWVKNWLVRLEEKYGAVEGATEHELQNESEQSDI